jgi:GT2 family glycosyltransferase
VPIHHRIYPGNRNDDTTHIETWEYLRTVKTVTVLGSQDTRLSFSEACNAGIRASASKYFVLLNSDTVVSRGWLESLVSTMDTTPRLACCGPLSNCDVGFRHAAGQYNMTLESGVTLHPGMKYGSVNIEELRQFMLTILP